MFEDPSGREAIDGLPEIVTTRRIVTPALRLPFDGERVTAEMKVEG